MDSDLTTSRDRYARFSKSAVLLLASVLTPARRLWRDRRGNIGMLFALMSTVLFLFVGGAVDYSRWNAVRADMIESMDAATLAIAQLAEDDETLTDAQLKQFGQEFFLENFNYEDRLKSGWNIDFDIQSGGNIATCIDADIATLLLGVADIPLLAIDKCVEITPQGSGRIELALVLDVTGSMDRNDDSGAHKMTSLKDAVTELLDVLFENETESDNVRVGIVPFNQHVNAGGASSWNDAQWGDQNAESFYHGARFFHVDEHGNVDMNTTVNHYRLYASDPHRSWEGCVEARPYPLDELDTPPGESTTTIFLNQQMSTPNYSDEPDSDVRDAFANMPDIDPDLTLSAIASAANSRFVPVFLADEADCQQWDDCDNGDYNESGWVDGYNWHGYWFDDPDDDSVLTYVDEDDYDNGQYIYDYRYTRHNQGTPFEKYVPIAGYFREVLSGAVNDQAFEDWLNDYGATSFGRQEYIARMGYVGWWDPATQTYDYKYDLPKGSNGDGPNPDNCPPAITPLTNQRATIDAARDALTPDGYTNTAVGAVWGWRVVSPQAPFTEAIGPGETGPNNTTEGDWQKAVLIMTDGNNDFQSLDTHYGGGESANGFEIEGRMGENVVRTDGSNDDHNYPAGALEMEEEADPKLLRICRRMKQEEILVYTIVFDVNAGSPIEDAFRSCATEPTSPFFFNAADGADLEEAFGLIADDLVKLHVSR